MAVYIEIFGTFDLTISESKTETNAHADPACTGNEDGLHCHGATVPPDNLLRLFGRHRD